MSVASVRNNFCRILKCQGKFTADCEREHLRQQEFVIRFFYLLEILLDSFNERFFSVNGPCVDIKDEVVIAC